MAKIKSLLSNRIVWVVVPSLAWAVLLALNLVPYLRGGFGWRWPYDPALSLSLVAPLILGTGLYVPGALWLLRRRSVGALLAWAFAGSLGLTVAAAYVRGDPFYRFYTITISGVAGGWHMAATRITDVAHTLRNWPQFMAASTSFSSHMGISPPGLVLIYHVAGYYLAHLPALADILGQPLRMLQCQNYSLLADTNAQLAAAWLGILMPVWGSLAIFPMYQVGRQVFGQDAARWSVAWWPLVPSLLIFAPLPNTFYPLPALLMVGLLLKGLRRNQPIWVFAAGLLMSGLTFLTFTFMPLLLLAGLLTLGMYWLKARRSEGGSLAWHWPVQMGLWFGLGLSVVWLIFSAATGLGPLAILTEATQAHLGLDRPYWPWLILHLNDFFMFTGWPLTLLAAVAAWSVGRKLSRKQPLAESDIVVLATGLTLVLLDISGTLRGESGRILLFLSPFVLLAAATALPNRQRVGAAATMTQGIVAVVIVICLNVLDSEFKPAPSAPPAQVSGAPAGTAMPLGASFGGLVRLDAFSGQAETRPDANGRDQNVLALSLSWESLRPVEVPYYLALLPVAPDGEVAPAATLLQPFQQQYPMTCWKPGDGEIRELVQVPMFKAEQGDWWVSFSLVDGATGHPLDVVAPDGSVDHQVGLGPIR